MLINVIEKFDIIHIAAIIVEHLPKVKTNALAYMRKVIDTGGVVEPSSIEYARKIEEANNSFFLKVGIDVLPSEWERVAKLLHVPIGSDRNAHGQIQECYLVVTEKPSIEG